MFKLTITVESNNTYTYTYIDTFFKYSKGKGSKTSKSTKKDKRRQYVLSGKKCGGLSILDSVTTGLIRLRPSVFGLKLHPPVSPST